MLGHADSSGGRATDSLVSLNGSLGRAGNSPVHADDVRGHVVNPAAAPMSCLAAPAVYRDTLTIHEEMQRDPNSLVTCFDVILHDSDGTKTHVDLSGDPEDDYEF